MTRIELMKRIATILINTDDVDVAIRSFNQQLSNEGWVQQSTNPEEIKRDAQEIINRTKNMIEDLDNLENCVDDIKDHAKLIKNDLVQLVMSIDD